MSRPWTLKEDKVVMKQGKRRASKGRKVLWTFTIDEIAQDLDRTPGAVSQRRLILQHRADGSRWARWHGTSGGYSNYGCRCTNCKGAWAAAARVRRAKGVSSDSQGGAP